MMRGLAILTLLFATACQAGGLSVSPMRLNFSAERGIGVVTLTNTSRETLTIEAEVRPWPEDAALQSAKDLVVNPPISTLAPGEKVSVRVGLVRRLATDVERGYRVYFTELPLLRAQDAVGVGVRLRLGIPVFVAAANAQPRALEWSVRRDDDGMLFTASNAGNVHQRVLKLSTQKGSVQYPAAQSSPYVMPGSSTAFRIPGLAARSGDTTVNPRSMMSAPTTYWGCRASPTYWDERARSSLSGGTTGR